MEFHDADPIHTGPSDELSQESEARVGETQSLGMTHVKPNQWPCPREKVLGGLLVQRLLGPHAAFFSERRCVTSAGWLANALSLRTGCGAQAPPLFGPADSAPLLESIKAVGADELCHFQLRLSEAPWPGSGELPV